MTDEVKTYSEVVKHLKSRQKHLLLGNGFSRSYADGIFSYNALTEFIHNNYDVPTFDFAMVIIPSEYQKFLDSPNYYRIEYDIAKPTNSTGLKGNSSSSLDSTIDAMEDINALKGSIVYSVGNNKSKSLNISQIRLFVQSLLKLNKKEDFVTTLKISGTDIDSDKPKVFDLVTNRLIENIEIEKQRINSKFFIYGEGDDICPPWEDLSQRTPAS